MSILGISANLAGAGLVLLSVSSQTALWQRKEYRIDRMRAWFSGGEARQQFGIGIMAGLFFLMCGWILYVVGAYGEAEVSGGIALISWAGHHISRIVRRGVYRPDFTVKALVVILLSILFAVVIVSGWIGLALLLSSLAAATAVLLAVPVVAVAVLIVNVPFTLKKGQIVRQAHKKMLAMRNLRVVGITGSYGKTSVKHFLNQLLNSAGVKSVSSGERRNSAVAVAQDMLKTLKANTRVYVAEMGAYRKGEITALVKLARPEIGVVTAIGNQHKALFGSQEKLSRAKWELIDGLPENGIAVLNMDDKMVYRMGQKKRSGKNVWYSTTSEAAVWAEKVKIGVRGIEATVHLGAAVKRVSIPLLGSGVLSNVLAAAAAARELGVSAAKVFAGIEKLASVPRTMELKEGLNGAVVIDDSYSANEAGVMDALAQLEKFKGFKVIVVMATIIELGDEAQAVHERIGKKLNGLKARVLLSSKINAEYIRRKVRSGEVTVIDDPKKLAEEAVKLIDKKTVVLLEGRIPDMVRKQLINTL